MKNKDKYPSISQMEAFIKELEHLCDPRGIYTGFRLWHRRNEINREDVSMVTIVSLENTRHDCPDTYEDTYNYVGVISGNARNVFRQRQADAKKLKDRLEREQEERLRESRRKAYERGKKEFGQSA